MEMPWSKEELLKSNKEFSYKGDLTKEISFPLGGIGTGSIGLSGCGRLMDWEIFNRPNKMSFNGYSFFAIKAESKGQVKAARVLQGDYQPTYSGLGKGIFEGFGFGVNRETLAGLPHFRETIFTGQFPIAQIDFQEPDFPCMVTLTAFNPFIPLNEFDSSLPAATYSYRVENCSNEDLDISLVGNLTNPFTEGAVNKYFEKDTSKGETFKGITCTSNHYASDHPRFGEITLSTDAASTSHQTYWFRGQWFDNLTMFWKEFVTPGFFKDRVYDEPRFIPSLEASKYQDVALLSQHKTLKPGEAHEFHFLITWSFPNYVNYWNPGSNLPNLDLPQWKNYYATQFKDSVASAYLDFCQDAGHKKKNFIHEIEDKISSISWGVLY